jgi:hypothetical protein
MEEIAMRATKGIVRVPTPRPTADVDLENRIANFLHHRKVPHSENVHAFARVGTVIVSGELPSRRAKWLCLECCRRVAGVIRLVDKLSVPSEPRLATPRHRPEFQLMLPAAPTLAT